MISNVLVLEVPLVRVRCNLLQRELAHLFPHGRVRLVHAGVAEGGCLRMLGDELGEPSFDRIAATGINQCRDAALLELVNFPAGQAKLAEANDLALTHGDAACDLRQIFAEPGREQEPLELAERAGLLEPSRPAAHLPQGLDVSREPGEAVQGMLGGIGILGPRLAAHTALGELEHALGGADGLVVGIETR